MQQKRWIKTKREHSEKALIRKGKKKKKGKKSGVVLRMRDPMREKH